MLRLPEFNFFRPESLKEAVAVLADLGLEALPVAGGTDLYPKMKRRQFTPKHVVSLRFLEELRGIRLATKGLWIGAGETLTQISSHPLVRQALPALAMAAHSVSTPQLRNVGTIGGNLMVDTRCNYYDQSFFWRKAANFCMKKDGEICLVAPGSTKCLAVFSSDTAPVLMSLGAHVVLAGPKGERRISLDELYKDDGMNFLTKEHPEILKGIHIPKSSMKQKNVYLKLRRRGSFDFPVLGVAVAAELTTDNICKSAKIVLTAVSSCPKVVDAAEALKGKKLTPEAIQAMAALAAELSRPVDNADMDVWYRKRMTKVYVAQALSSISGGAAPL